MKLSNFGAAQESVATILSNMARYPALLIYINNHYNKLPDDAQEEILQITRRDMEQADVDRALAIINQYKDGAAVQAI